MLHICVKLEHAYIRNVNDTPTDRQTDRHDHRLTDHVGLAQARPNDIRIFYLIQDLVNFLHD